MASRRDSLYRRALLVNGGVLVAGAALLAGTPATVSFPIIVAELVIVAFGVGVMVGLNAALLRWVVAPADDERPAAAAPHTRDPAVVWPDREIAGTGAVFDEIMRTSQGFLVDTIDAPLGIVDEVETDVSGRPDATTVAAGWFGTRRYVGSLDAVLRASLAARRPIVDPRRVRGT